MTFGPFIIEILKFSWGTVWYFQNNGKNNIRTLIKHCYWRRKFHQNLEISWKVLQRICSMEKKICRLFSVLKCGRTDTNDVQRSECPTEGFTPKSNKIINKTVLDNHEVKEQVWPFRKKKNSIGCVHHISHEYLGFRKICLKWVPVLLTVDQNHQRVDDSERCLKVLKRTKFSFHAVWNMGWKTDPPSYSGATRNATVC